MASRLEMLLEADRRGILPPKQKSMLDEARRRGLIQDPGDQGAGQQAAPQGSESGLVDAVIQAESGGDPNAVSPTGARGLMQVQPQTARDPGFGLDPIDPSQLSDPQANREFGTQYLNAMLERYGGDQEAALIAYNAGPGNADRWLEAGRNYAVLPKRQETEPYVRRVLGAMQPQGASQPAPQAPQASQTPQAPQPAPAPRQSLQEQAVADPMSPAAMMRDAGRLEGQAPQGRPAEDLPNSADPIDTLMRLVNQGASGVTEGLASLAALPVDLMNQAPQLINLLPGEQGVGPMTERPIGGASRAHEGLRMLGLTAPPAESAPGRIARRTGQEVGATAIPAGAGLRAARTASQATTPIGKMLDRFFVEPFRQAPAKATATEAALATGAGAGAGVANEFAPGSAGADVGGAAAGSLATGGALGLGRLGAELARGAVSPRSEARGAIRKEVGRRLRENATDPENLTRRIDEGLKAQEAVPGMRQTTGVASNDPGIQSLEFSRRNSTNAGTFRQRDTENNQAARQGLRDLGPEAADDAATRAALEGRRDRALGRAGQATQRRQGAVEAGLERSEPPLSSSQEGGRLLREGVESQRESLVKRRSDVTDPDLKAAVESDAKVDARPVVRLINSKLQNVKREAVVSALKKAHGFLQKRGAAAGESSLDDSVAGLYEARKAINDLIAGRTEDSTGRFAQSELKEVRNALDAQIAKAEPAFERYIKRFREESAPINQLDEGATGRVLEKDKLTGTPKVPGSAVASEFFKSGKGSPESIQEFVKKVGGQDKAAVAIYDHALREGRKAFESGGAEGLRKWVSKHSDALAAFPKVRREFGSLADAQDAVKRAQRREKLLADATSNPRKSTIAKYLDRDEAKESMGAILNSRNPEREMDGLMRFIRNDKDAVEGAKRAFFEHLEDQIASQTEDLAGSPFIQAGKFKKILRKNNPALERLYKDDPVQLDRVRKLADVVARGQNTARARPPGQSGTALAQRNLNVPGLTVAGFTARAFAVKRGVVSPFFVIAETTLRAGRRAIVKVNNRQFEDLLDRALLDPEVAKTLLMEVNDSNANIIGRRMRLHLGQEASTAASGEAPDKRKDR